MTIQCLRLSGVALLTLLATLPTPADGISFVSDRAALGSNDQLDWSSLGKVFHPLAPNPTAFFKQRFLGHLYKQLRTKGYHSSRRRFQHYPAICVSNLTPT
ncbi:hypothetical protein [Microseira sp. BLCC-F43]|uniref:hypothetical protein n=1 Tax=Microseira sp. BLCC-F43 TaxID=3153602 RepID=UPI0035B7F9F5